VCRKGRGGGGRGGLTGVLQGIGDLVFSSLLCAVMTYPTLYSFNVFFCVCVRDMLCFGGVGGVHAGIAIV